MFNITQNRVSFNRYIVECKVSKQSTHICGGISFNRYIVECKVTIIHIVRRHISVLIDT